MRTNFLIDRRTCLKGIGASLALPLLQTMGWADSTQGKPFKPPVRLGFMYMPHGVIMDQFWPADPESFLTTPPPALDSLRPVLDQCLLMKGISGGQKKLLELGRTMMVDAKIVFLDEVGAGVNRTLLNTIADAILRLNRERGYTFCVIEHDMDFIARLCDPVIVMAQGKVLAQGTVDEVKNDERVIEAYLGTGLKNKVVAHA